MKKVFTLIVLSVALYSCSQDETLNDTAVSEPEKAVAGTPPPGVLCFSSAEDLNFAISAMKETKNLDIRHNPMTRAAVAGPVDGFVSLREHLIDQGLREFSDAELAEIIADSLEYEPEDSLIVDPYMTAILNGEREVQVGDKICRFIDDGLVVYEANDKVLFDPNNIEKVETKELSHGQTIDIADNKGIGAKLIKIKYEELVVTDGNSSSSGGSGNNNNSTVSYNDDGSITLSTGVKIPRDKIRRTSYTKGGGNGSWLAKGVSGFLGLNVSLTNNFDKRHRMKLRMYDQDYILYRAIGMTIRMQKRLFRVWWRKKAPELRYGWTAIECEYTYPKPTFLDPPKMPNGLPKHDKYPTAIIKKFPFSNPDIVLFHVPLVNYDVNTGNVNSLLASGIKKSASKINSWFKDQKNQKYKTNPQGIFTTDNKDKTMYVVFPQGEKYSYNDGREVHRWDMQWFSGNVLMSFGIKGGGWSLKPKEMSPANNMKILRGQVYGAVKYRNQWRACVIEAQ